MQMSQNINSREQVLHVLKNEGIDNSTLIKIKNIVNSPMAGALASFLGVDVAALRNGLNNLIGGTSASYGTAQTARKNNDFGSDFDKLKNGLSQLRHR